MSGIENSSNELITSAGKIMFYFGSLAFLLTLLYLLFDLSGIEKKRTWNDAYSNSVKNLLPVFIRNGFLMIFSGLAIGTILFFTDGNKAILLLPAMIFIAGLMFLLVAWHIRQGLLYVRFVELAVKLQNMPRSVHGLFLFQFCCWTIMFICWIECANHPFLVMGGCTLLIAGMSLLLILKLKKIKND